MLKVALPRTQKYLLGALLSALSIYALINSQYTLGIPSLILAVAVATTYNYIAFDFAAGYQGEFTYLFGIIPVGGWKRLPTINHVFLKRFSELVKQEISDSGVYQTIRNQRYNIMFSVADSNQGTIVLEVQNLKKARKIAQDIASAGNLQLKDYTGQ